LWAKVPNVGKTVKSCAKMVQIEAVVTNYLKCPCRNGSIFGCDGQFSQSLLDRAHMKARIVRETS